MSILKLPTDSAVPTEVICGLCTRHISPDCATFGPINAEGNITILCAGHLWGGLSFIDQLADYAAKEREKFLRNNGDNMRHFGGGGQDAWSVY